MGVRGLTTYIKNNEKKFLKHHKLNNCIVLLDGNSIAANLFIWSNIESAFGGDYDKFAKYVKEFLKLLQKCEIRPLVLFDGGYEQRKLKTVYTRLREKFRTACQAQPFTGSTNFPLFMRIVFREVLTEMKIPFAQSDFEADDELAALARQLKCPVLSYDSDFFIYDVLYIPLPSLNLIPVEYRKSVEDGSRAKFYLECKIYSVDVFTESFGGLDKSMLPLLAALLGNDYIKRSVFKKFYTNLKIPKGKTNHLQRRIKAVIEWLRHETFESAVQKILSRMRKKHRRFVLRQLRRIVNGYVQCESMLSQYLGVHIDTQSLSAGPNHKVVDKDNKIDPSIVSVIENIKIGYIEDCTETHDEVSNDDDDDSFTSSDEEVSSEEFEASELPEDAQSNEILEDQILPNDTPCMDDSLDIPHWILDLARRGKVQSCVFDILSLQQYFFPPQVEDFSLSPSHLVSLKILNATVGLLLGENGKTVKYWTRSGSQLASYYVEPIKKTASFQFPSREKILDMSEHQRRTILLEVAEIDIEIDLTRIPEEWHLFIVAIIFWLRNMEHPSVAEAHLHTMVMCLVGIYAIDSSIGVYRNRQTFMRKYRNFLNKTIAARNKGQSLLKDTTKLTSNVMVNDEIEDVDPAEQLANITNEDCIVIFETVLPYHHVSEQVKMKPKLFSLTTVHAFAQFQSSLFHLMVLNSVLGFPMRDCVVSRMFSGTFVYNIFQNFSKRNNITAYVENLLHTCPSLLKLYKMLVNYIQKYLHVSLSQNMSKSRRKKKKQNKETKMVDLLKEGQEDERGEMFIDENNMFSGLALNAT